MRAGAQLYTVRMYCQNACDLDETLRRLSSIGYTAVQLSGIGSIEPDVIRDLCQKYSLDIVLTHTNPERIASNVQSVIKEHDIYQCPLVGIGSMPEKYRSAAWINRFSADYLPSAQALRKSGKLLMYHNHNFEWEKLPDGKRIIDIILNAFPPELLGITLDTYWVQAAGADPCEWIRRLKGRIPCVHVKDMSVKGYTQRFAPIGDGNINFGKIVDILNMQGGTDVLLVEQDDCYDEDPFCCMERSFNTLYSLGVK